MRVHFKHVHNRRKPITIRLTYTSMSAMFTLTCAPAVLNKLATARRVLALEPLQALAQLL